jgi:hypothetical protein
MRQAETVSDEAHVLIFFLFLQSKQRHVLPA